MLDRINNWEEYAEARELYREIVFNSEKSEYSSHHLQSLAHAIREKMADFERRVN